MVFYYYIITVIIIQGPAFKIIIDAVKKPNIGLWSKVLDSLPSTKLIFAHKAPSQMLPTAANLVR